MIFDKIKNYILYFYYYYTRSLDINYGSSLDYEDEIFIDNQLILTIDLESI
jgi:hypothetical protein